jgi:competence protein ComEC
MAIVFGIVFTLLRVLGVPRAASGFILIPLIWFYVALTGWPASAIRATIMLTVVIAAWVLKRPTDLINSLFAAAIIILVWQPQQLFQAGFQLSFFVVLCIIVTMPVLQDLMKRLFAPDPLLAPSLRRRWPPLLAVPAKFIGDTFLTSFAAWIGALPLVAYYFNIVTPVSTPANLLAVPLCALVLISNLASLLLAGWFPLATELFNHAGWGLMECIRVSSEWFAKLPAAYYYVSAPSLVATVLYYFALLAIVTGWLFVERARRWKIAGFGLALACWFWQVWHQAALTQLTVLPVGGAAALYLDAPRTADDLLIDCGNANSAESTTKTFLRSQGVNGLSNLVLTHGDVRHVGGAEIIEDLFTVKHAWISPVRFRSSPYRQVVESLGRSPGRLKTLSRGEKLGCWSVLHPGPEDHFPQADDNAMVLLGVFGTNRVLLLSDLGRSGQRALMDRTADLHADIVVAGLPDDGEPLSDGLLDSIRPRVMVITDSEFPARERVTQKLRERLERRNVPVLYTRTCRAVTVQFRKGGWSVRAMDGTKVTSQELHAAK